MTNVTILLPGIFYGKCGYEHHPRTPHNHYRQEIRVTPIHVKAANLGTARGFGTHIIVRHGPPVVKEVA